MFCPTCGEAIKGGERFCANCGADLTTTGAIAAPMGQPVVGPALEAPARSVVSPSTATTAAVPAAARVAAPVAPAAMRGVGGWLLLFCLWMTIVHPLMALRLVPYLRYVAMNPFLLVSLGLTAFSVVIGILLWSGNRSGVLLLRAYFPLLAVLSLLGAFRYFSEVHYFSFAFWMVYTWGQTLAFLVIWVWYFRVSVRVRNTYGMNL